MGPKRPENAVRGLQMRPFLRIFAQILTRMSEQLEQRIERIRAKCMIVTERYETLLASKREADAEIARLTKQNASQAATIEQLRSELRYLRMASAISPTREDRESTRALLSELVREIDKCINDLTH